MSVASASAPAPAAPAGTAVASELLGPLVVPEEARFAFPAGLYGFREHHEFALLPAGRPGLWWLQATGDPVLAFLVADPFPVFPDYAPDVPEAELAQLGGGEPPAPEHVAAFVIVTLPGAGAVAASANLRAPVLLDTRTRRGRQVVLPAEARGVAEPFPLP